MINVMCPSLPAADLLAWKDKLLPTGTLRPPQRIACHIYMLRHQQTLFHTYPRFPPPPHRHTHISPSSGQSHNLQAKCDSATPTFRAMLKHTRFYWCFCFVFFTFHFIFCGISTFLGGKLGWKAVNKEDWVNNVSLGD